MFIRRFRVNPSLVPTTSDCTRVQGVCLPRVRYRSPSVFIILGILGLPGSPVLRTLHFQFEVGGVGAGRSNITSKPVYSITVKLYWSLKWCN